MLDVVELHDLVPGRSDISFIRAYGEPVDLLVTSIENAIRSDAQALSLVQFEPYAFWMVYRFRAYARPGFPEPNSIVITASS